MPLQSVYIQKDNENEGPPPRVLKTTFSPGGRDSLDNFRAPVVFFAIGDYDESTWEDSFKTDESRTFSITLEDLLHSLVALGALRYAETAVDLLDPHAA